MNLNFSPFSVCRHISWSHSRKQCSTTMASNGNGLLLHFHNSCIYHRKFQHKNNLLLFDSTNYWKWRVISEIFFLKTFMAFLSTSKKNPSFHFHFLALRQMRELSLKVCFHFRRWRAVECSCSFASLSLPPFLFRSLFHVHNSQSCLEVRRGELQIELKKPERKYEQKPPPHISLPLLRSNSTFDSHTHTHTRWQQQ